MSVAFQTNTDTNRIQLPLPSMWIYNTSAAANPNWSNKLPAVKEEDDSTSSSIGNNSDADKTDSDEDDDDAEVQSKDNRLINTNLNDLEKALPIKYAFNLLLCLI